MSEQELKAALERLKTENEALKNRGFKAISMKVSEKGGVSIYGLGRFPVTLYREQWLRLLDMADDIRSSARRFAGIRASSVGVSSVSPIEWHQVVKLLAVSAVTVDQVVDVVADPPTFRAPHAAGLIRFFHWLRSKPVVDGLPFLLSFPYLCSC